MTPSADLSTLSALKYLPYINADGQLPEQFASKVGIYAIYDHEKCLQFVGYSRDIFMSLQQHLVRCPNQCHWIKVETVSRPSRTLLETVRDAWITENGSIPSGNLSHETQWTQPIDVKVEMTAEEHAACEGASNETDHAKTLKKIARRTEAAILSVLHDRGLKTPIRFDPKLKEQGLLNVKP
ncbi:MAG TPA: GIY-YIG nuclease family protein [Elainellaceae cyanobacterium]